MAFWLFHISDEFKNQKNFSYFTNFQPRIKSDLNTNAPEYHSPQKQSLPINLDFMDTIEDYSLPKSPVASPRSPVASPVASPRSPVASPVASPRSPVKSPASPRSIKVYHNKRYKKK